MSLDNSETIVLAVVPTELEAELILEALEERSIRAEAAGQLTAGYKAEAPGGVRILVRREDAARGLQAMQVFQTERSHLDWSQVDIGERE